MYTEQQLYIRENEAESYEHLVYFDHFDKYTFFDMEKISQKDYPFSYNDKSFEKGTLYQTVIYRDNLKMLHERKIYGFLDLLGTLGGVIEILILVFGFFLNPIAEFSFTLKAI